MAGRRLGFWRRLVVMLVKPVLTGWTKRTWTGMAHIPATGGAIIVANHLSHADPVVIGHYVYDAGRWPSFLAKASVFRAPVVGYIISRCQQIPVERGSVDAARSRDTLVAAVKDGSSVIIYPEGTTSKQPDLWPMKGKTGAARLALITGAPVIPIVMDGPQALFDPRTSKVGLRPRIPVRVHAGPAIDLHKWSGAAPTRHTLDAMTEEIMLHLRDMLAELRGVTDPPPLWSPPRQRKEAGPAATETATGTATGTATSTGEQA